VRHRGILVAAVGLLLVACTPIVTSTTAPAGPTTTPTTTSTVTILPATTSTTSTSTTSTTVTTLPATTTTTVPPSGPVVHIEGPTVCYSVDGHLVVQGWVEDAEVVTFDGAELHSYEDPGRIVFWAELELASGTHDFTVTATGSDGITSEQPIEVIADPNLVVEFAYVESVDPAAGTIVADYAEWYVGDPATIAAREDGVIGPDQFIDFYVRNNNPRLRTLTVDVGIQVALYACYRDPGPCVALEPVDLHTWAQLLANPDSDVVPWFWYGYGSLPYWLTIDDGVIVQVEEQYLP